GKASEFARRKGAFRARPTAVRADEAGIRETLTLALLAMAMPLAPEKSCDHQTICLRQKEGYPKPAVMLRALPHERRHEPLSARPVVLNPVPYTETGSAEWQFRARQVRSRSLP